MLSLRSCTASLIKLFSYCIKAMPAGPARAQLPARKQIVEFIFLGKNGDEEKIYKKGGKERNGKGKDETSEMIVED